MWRLRKIPALLRRDVKHPVLALLGIIYGIAVVIVATWCSL
jgi:hypothetical protein